MTIFSNVVVAKGAKFHHDCLTCRWIEEYQESWHNWG